MSTAAAPSEICDALPAVILPSATKGAFKVPSFSTVDPRRMPSSAVTAPSAVDTDMVSSTNSPSSCAAAARSWDSTEYSSSCARDNP